ncbi:MAG: hypothetical protein CSA58_09370 [Micrococcales bacterium]|nr:MAG: hypothetical protein CSA58_09370 [Micrococcales bacterium]
MQEREPHAYGVELPAHRRVRYDISFESLVSGHGYGIFSGTVTLNAGMVLRFLINTDSREVDDIAESVRQPGIPVAAALEYVAGPQPVRDAVADTVEYPGGRRAGVRRRGAGPGRR